MDNTQEVVNTLELIGALAQDAKEAASQDAPVGHDLCPVCRRPLVARKEGRGRKKEVHRRCGILRSRMAEMEDMLRGMEFGDDTAVRILRGNLFAMVNNTLRKSVVVINPDNAEDV